MSQSEKAQYFRALKDAGVQFDKHYREYKTDELRAAYEKLVTAQPELAAPPQPQPQPRPPRSSTSPRPRARRRRPSTPRPRARLRPRRSPAPTPTRCPASA